ncbi:MAG: HEPN domain-containing protein [Bacteroidales bacterium]|jgi:uncharacterized protein (UPF0332 family)|nr:HEPN domain-containing protein [Bacteroidales bacterium]
MTLEFQDRNAIVSLRLQGAKDALQEAKGNIEMEYWRVAANRLYYACYYAASALLISNGYLARTHSGVISLLNLHFVSKGLISKEQGHFFGNLFELRQSGDYNDWKIIKAEDVQSKIVPAEEFVATVEKMISSS